MNDLNLPVSKPLHLKLPVVYRYLDPEFVDLFFNKGILRISSFEHFREYPDEIRGDKSEGGGSVHGRNEKEKFSYVLMTQVGSNGYMMSASLVDSDELRSEFETEECFRIHDPINFAAAISNALLGVAQLYVGFCNYQDRRTIEKTTEGISKDDLSDGNGNLIIGGPGMAKIHSNLIGNGTDLMFLKEKKYQTQSEFRFIWTINTKFFDMNKWIDVKCPEAIQYCERHMSQPADGDNAG